MKVSELMEQLEKIKKEYGDLPVNIVHGGIYHKAIMSYVDTTHNKENTKEVFIDSELDFIEIP